jgi:hypothetical protein
MGRRSKVAVTVIVVIAMMMIVTGIVGATASFPDTAERQPTVPFEQQKTVPAQSFDAVKIDGRTVDVQVSTADVNEAQIRLNGKLYQPDPHADKFIEINVRRGELRISFAKEMLITELQVFGIEVVGEAVSTLQAELVLPQRVYRSIEIRTLTGDVLLRGVEARMLDVESEMGDIVFETAQKREQFSLEIESDHGDVTIFGEAVRAEREFADEEDHGYEYEDRYWDEDAYSSRYFVGNGSQWVQLKSEHGSIDVRGMN